MALHAGLIPFNSETARLAARKPRGMRMPVLNVIAEIPKVKQAWRRKHKRRWSEMAAEGLLEEALDRESPHRWTAMRVCLKFDPLAEEALNDEREATFASAPRIIIQGPESAVTQGAATACIDVEASVQRNGYYQQSATGDSVEADSCNAIAAQGVDTQQVVDALREQVQAQSAQIAQLASMVQALLARANASTSA